MINEGSLWLLWENKNGPFDLGPFLRRFYSLEKNSSGKKIFLVIFGGLSLLR